MKSPIVTPNPKHVTQDNFIKWYEERIFGTHKGSLGMKHSTVGKAMNFEEFHKNFSKMQSK
jgi:hypothetical protein